MKTSRTHGLIVFLLSVVSTYRIIASVRDDEDRFRIIVRDQSVNGGSFYESFDVYKDSLLWFVLFKFDTLLSESR
jgi:hypothetical protein